MKRMVRLIQLPQAGDHAAIFIGVGISQHDFLPPAPGVEKGAIFGGVPHPFHMLEALRSAAIDSKSGTGMRPGSSLLPASGTPAIFARRRTASMWSSDSTPLIT